MNSLPRITLVTPTYNQGHFIEQTLESIRQQNYPNFEHIVVDAMSTDNTGAILDAYAKTPSVRVIREPDKGQSDGINKGMRAATGEVVGWLNSDDMLCENALLKIGETFANHPDAVVVYGLGAKVDRQGELIRWVPFREFDRKALKTAYRVIQPAMFFKKDVYWKTGGLDIDLHYAMDWELLIRMAQRGDVISIPDEIAKIRFYEDTKTSTGGWKRMQEIAEIGRKYNGLTDANYISFIVRSIAAKIPLPFLRKAVDHLSWRIWKGTPVMVHGWP
ncbi:MAG: glycosyltransferase family 2 protein [Chthoniobacterales bacterium]